MHSPVILQLMGVRLCTRVEEPCKLDSLLRNIFKAADDILRLPITPSVKPVHEWKEGRTLYMLVTYPMHDRAAFCLREELGQVVDALGVLKEELRFSRFTPLGTARERQVTPEVNVRYLDEVENDQRRPISFEEVVKVFSGSDRKRIGNGNSLNHQDTM